MTLDDAQQIRMQDAGFTRPVQPRQAAPVVPDYVQQDQIATRLADDAALKAVKVNAVQAQKEAQPFYEPPELGFTRKVRGRIDEVANIKKKQLKDFDTKHAGLYSVGEDGKADNTDLNQLQIDAQDKVGVIHGALSPFSAAGDATDKAIAAKTSLDDMVNQAKALNPNIRGPEDLAAWRDGLAQQRARLAQEHDDISAKKVVWDQKYGDQMAAVYGDHPADPVIPPSVAPKVAAVQAAQAQGKPVESAPEVGFWNEFGKNAADLGRSFGSGAGGLVKMVGDIYGLTTGDMDNATSNFGHYVQDYWNHGKSADLKAREQGRTAAIAAAPDEFGKAMEWVKSTVSDPSLLANAVGEQIPQLLPGVGVGALTGKVAAKLLLRKAISDSAKIAAAHTAAAIGTAGGVGGGAVLQGADVGGDSYTDSLARLQAMTPEQAQQIPEIAAAVGAGEDIDVAKTAYALAQGRKVGVGAAAISLLANSIPGGNLLERAAARAGAGAAKGAASSLGREIAKIGAKAAGEAGSEMVEEGGGQIVSNLAAQQGVDPNRPTFQDVGQTVAQAGLVGFTAGVPAAISEANVAHGAENEAPPAADQGTASAPPPPASPTPGVDEQFTPQMDDELAASMAGPAPVAPAAEAAPTPSPAAVESAPAPLNSDNLQGENPVPSAAENITREPQPISDAGLGVAPPVEGSAPAPVSTGQNLAGQTQASVPDVLPPAPIPAPESVAVPPVAPAPATSSAVAAPAPVPAATGQDTPQAEKPMPAAAEANFRLPHDLSGAKPRYSYGAKQFTLNFASDLDKALYVLAQSTPSKRDADFVKTVTEQTGLTEVQARNLGKTVRDRIKAGAKDAPAGELSIPVSAQAQKIDALRAKRQPAPAVAAPNAEKAGAEAKGNVGESPAGRQLSSTRDVPLAPASNADQDRVPPSQPPVATSDKPQEQPAPTPAPAPAAGPISKPLIARGENTPATFARSIVKATSLKQNSDEAKVIMDFAPRLHRIAPKEFEGMEVHALDETQWATQPETSRNTPDSAAAYNPTTNTLYLNTAKLKTPDAIVSAIVHESGHFAERFGLGTDFTQAQWESLTDGQREASAKQYDENNVDHGADLKNDPRARAEWVAMQFARVVRGDTQGMGAQIKAKLTKFLMAMREFANKWIGSERLTTKELDAKIVDMMFPEGGEAVVESAPAAKPVAVSVPETKPSPANKETDETRIASKVAKVKADGEALRVADVKNKADAATKQAKVDAVPVPKTEGALSFKDTQRELLAQVDAALKTAPSEADSKNPGTVTVKSGTSTIRVTNTKEALGRLRDGVAKRIGPVSAVKEFDTKVAIGTTNNSTITQAEVVNGYENATTEGGKRQWLDLMHESTLKAQGLDKDYVKVAPGVTMPKEGAQALTDLKAGKQGSADVLGTPSRTGDVNAPGHAARLAEAAKIQERFDAEEQVAQKKREDAVSVDDMNDEDHPGSVAVSHPDSSTWIVYPSGDKWYAESDQGSRRPLRNSKADAIDDAKDEILNEVGPSRGTFGNNDLQANASSELFGIFKLPEGASQTGWETSKWGSWYNKVTLDAESDEPVTLKLSIRDHEATRTDMGHNDITAMVSKEWTPAEVAAALDRVEMRVLKKAGQEPTDILGTPAEPGPEKRKSQSPVTERKAGLPVPDEEYTERPHAEVKADADAHVSKVGKEQALADALNREKPMRGDTRQAIFINWSKEQMAKIRNPNTTPQEVEAITDQIQKASARLSPETRESAREISYRQNLNRDQRVAAPMQHIDEIRKRQEQVIGEDGQKAVKDAGTELGKADREAGTELGKQAKERAKTVKVSKGMVEEYLKNLEDENPDSTAVVALIKAMKQNPADRAKAIRDFIDETRKTLWGEYRDSIAGAAEKAAEGAKKKSEKAPLQIFSDDIQKIITDALPKADAKGVPFSAQDAANRISDILAQPERFKDALDAAKAKISESTMDDVKKQAALDALASLSTGKNIVGDMLNKIVKSVFDDMDLTPKQAARMGNTKSGEIAAEVSKRVAGLFSGDIAKQMSSEVGSIVGNMLTDARTQIREQLTSAEIKKQFLAADELKEADSLLANGTVEEIAAFLGTKKGPQENERIAALQKELSKKNTELRAILRKKLHNLSKDELTQVVREAFKAMQTSLADLAKEHVTKTDATAKDLAKRLVEEAGLSEAVASQVAADLDAAARTLIADARKKALTNLKAKTDKAGTVRAKKVVSAIDKALALNNLGALTDGDLMAAVAKELKLPQVTPENLRKIAEIAERVETAPNTRVRAIAETELLKEMRIVKGITAADVGLSVWFANMLSGFTTHIANTQGNSMLSTIQLMTLMASDPKNAGHAFAGWVNGLSDGFLHARDILKTGTSNKEMGEAKLGESDSVQILETVDYARDFKRLPSAIAAGLQKHAAVMKYVSRAMRAGDAVFFYPAREGFARVAAAKILGAEFQGKELHGAIRDLLGIAPDQFIRYAKQADAEGWTGMDKALRVSQLMEEQRNTTAEGRDVETSSAQFARESTLNNDPVGWAGVAYKIAKESTSKIPAMKLFLPFLRVPTNLFNMSLNFTPVGALRAKFSMKDSDGKSTKPMTAEESARLYIQATAGSLAMVGIAAAALAGGDDDKERWFDITAKGTGDWKQNEQLEQTGWRAFTIKMGDLHWSYKDSPLLLPLAAIGQLVDAQRYQKGKDTLAGKNPYLNAMLKLPQTIFETSMLSGLGTLMDIAQGNTSPQKIDSFISNSATSAVIPNLAKQVDRTISPERRESDGVAGNLGQSIPGLRQTGSIKPDVLGQPIERSPMDRFASMETNNALREVLRDKNVYISTPSKNTKIGNAPMTEDQYRIYYGSYGNAMRVALEPMASQMRRMTSEQVEKLVNAAETQAKKVAMAKTVAGSRRAPMLPEPVAAE